MSIAGLSSIGSKGISARLSSLFTLLLMLLSNAAVANDSSPYLYVLGSAQDAGHPQAGCYQPHCMRAWKDPALREPATSLGLIDPRGKRKYLFEATPNLPEQLYQLQLEAPSDAYRLKGIFLTHAHMGHYTGLVHLGHEAMGADQIPVFAMPRMYEFLESNGPWSQLVAYENIKLKSLKNRSAVTLGDLRVTPIEVPHRDEYSETVGYQIDGPDKSAIFIPDINSWDSWELDLAAIVAARDYALIDATFYSADELPGRERSQFPHPLVTDTMKRLSKLSKEDRDKVWFIHLNHSNPLLDPNSKASKKVESRGFNIARRGLRLPL